MAFKKPEIITLIFIASLILSMSMVVAREAQESKWVECDDDPCHQPTLSPPFTPSSGDHGGARGHYNPPPPKSQGPQYTYHPLSDPSSADRRGGRGYYSPPPLKFQGPYYYTHPPPSPSDNNCTTPDPPNLIIPYYPYYYYRGSPATSSAVSILGTTAMLLSFVLLVG